VRLKTAFIFSLFFISIYAFGQFPQMEFESVSTDQGLSNNIVNCILQDKKGYIWVGTSVGLNKLNGYEIKTYQTTIQSENTNSLKDSEIKYIYESKNGQLYITTNSAISLYQPEQDNFKHIYSKDYNAVKLDILTIQSEDNEGNLIARNNKYIFTINSKSFERKRISLPENKLGFINQIKSHENKQYITSTNGLFIYNHNFSKELYHYKPSNKSAAFQVFIDKSNTIWVTAHEYFTKIDSELTSFREIKLIQKNNSPIVDILSITGDERFLFINTSVGLITYNKASEEYTYNNTFSKNNALSPHSLTCFYIDKYKNFWIGTMKGVNYHYTGQSKFKHQLIPTSKSKNAEISTTDIYQNSQGDYLIGTFTDGLVITDKEFRFKKILHSATNGLKIHSNMISSILDLGNDKYWIGTYNLAITEIDLKNNRSKWIRNDENDLFSIKGWSIRIMKQKGKNIFIASLDKGLEIYDQTSGQFKCFPYDSSGKSGIMSQQIWDIDFFENGNIILATDDKGIVVFNPFLKKSKSYILIDNKNSIEHSFQILKTKNNKYYSATASGLIEFDTTKQYQKLHQQNDLKKDKIYCMSEDKDGNIWLSTNSGIKTFNTKTSTFNNFDKSDGLRDSEFNHNASYVNKEGLFLFGGQNGITLFNPCMFITDTTEPKSLFYKVSVFGSEILPNVPLGNTIILKKPIDETQTIEFNYDHKIITFHLFSSHMGNTKATKYRYRLIGFDKNFTNWIQIEYPLNSINFTSLDPGKYQLDVISCNPDDIWQTIPTSLQIIVHPPYWRTWWFRFLSLALIVLSISLIFWGRIKQIKIQKNKLEKLVREKTKEIKQHSEVLRMVNRDLSAQKEELLQQKEELQSLNTILEERQEEVIVQKESLEKQAIELIQLNATKDKFFSIIGHDLKNPFHSISGLSQLLLEMKEIDEIQRNEMIKMIKESSNSASMLLENLLTWARSQSGNIQFKPEIFYVSEIVKQCFILLQLSADKKKITLQNTIDKELQVNGDVNMLLTIIRNLISNSIKFTPNDGIISLYNNSNPTRNIEIIIEDNGIGMDESTIKKLFRIDSNITLPGTQGERGTGLGLIICKEFIQLHKGSISVESTLGKGSKFIITLPKL